MSEFVLGGCRDVFGDAAVVGDRRWGGGWGIDAELWARSKVFREEKWGVGKGFHENDGGCGNGSQV